MLYLDDILYEIEESEIWSFNYNIMEGTIYLSIVNPYTAVRHEMTIEKYTIFSLCIVQIKKKKKIYRIIPFVEMSYIGTDKIEFPLKKS